MGSDLSGSLSAMGGVGALVQITDYTDSTTSYLPGYDGSGNVAVLFKSDGTLSATYEYSPFGESLRKEGAYAKANPFRFSTKYTDEETGLVYYGHRYYSPSLGRFLNQDPVGIQGGVNLYAFVGNDPLNGWDYLGLVNQANADPAAYFASLSPEEQARRQMLWQTFSGGLALMDAMDAARTSYSGLWIVASPATAASSGDFSEASRARDAEAQRAAADWARILATPGSWSVLSIGSDTSNSSKTPNRAGSDTAVPGSATSTTDGGMRTGKSYPAGGGSVIVQIYKTFSASNSLPVGNGGVLLVINYNAPNEKNYQWIQIVTKDTFTNKDPNKIVPYVDQMSDAQGNYYYNQKTVDYVYKPGQAIFQDRPYGTGPGELSFNLRLVDTTKNDTTVYQFQWGFIYNEDGTVTAVPVTGSVPGK